MSSIAVIGTGYVGLTTAACFADLGNDVCGVDADTGVVETLHRGQMPFYEPGLEEIVRRNADRGRLHFTTSTPDAIADAEFVFLAVGTPVADGGEPDLSQVRSAAATIGAHLRAPVVIVNKSTVPIGTGDVVGDIVGDSLTQPVEFAVVANPEFLREGSAVHDFMSPDRVVIGSHDADSARRVAELYKPLHAPVLVTTLYAAEMIKYASNAFLATKISFINEIARVCEKLDADIEVVARGMGLDKRIGAAFLNAGLGYGGSCFPKDVLALSRMSESIGAHPQLLTAVMEINDTQVTLLVEKLHDVLGPLRGLTIGLLGLAFKPNTDDMREAPSLGLVAALQKKGAAIRAYDPVAMPRAARLLPDVLMQRDAYAVARDADALIVATEWNEFRQLDFRRLKKLMKRAVIIDGRNIYDPQQLKDLGFVHRGVGR
ncbi:MAG TPA: UDP-glucose/GDP-mannose dehydrogenase family protein [Candidatus Dormibacteraeota bacterium]